jgi:hypothetical protein
VDSLPIRRGRAHREGAGNFDPTILALRNITKLLRDFGQVLVLAEHEGHVEEIPPREANHVDRDAMPFSSAFKKAVCVPSGNLSTLFL